MPVKKKTTNKETLMKDCTAEQCMIKNSTMSCCSPSVKRIMVTLVGIFLVYLITLFGTMIRNNIREYYFIGHEDRTERTITVSADAKVTAKPDIAMTTIGMIASGGTVEAAQEQNTTVMNSLISNLKNLGVSSDDIQTANYSIYPQYDYTQEEGRVLRGYEVSQSVSVKIRNLEIANNVLALAGQVGANSVSGLDFIIDDREVYRTEARQKALKKVEEKARALAEMLDVSIISVVSFDEYESGADIPQPYMALEKDLGFGGAGAPQIESGSLDVGMHVSVTFEIR